MEIQLRVVKTQGSEIWIQVDMTEISIVKEIYLYLIVNTEKGGNHTIYASNFSGGWENGTVLYSNESLSSVINVNAVFRYLIYVNIPDENSSFEVCEIGIVGCPPAYYGPICTKTCPVNCSGPCDLETGNCIFGCSNGWIGDKCELGEKNAYSFLRNIRACLR
ncbi:unnamed protein product [Mytilus coruscus]|uniref:MEGF10_11 n=1 Tax=Mytilus coruscus TaxID=42192 RepID=A0A6J8AAD0_MYTCO|nr:unnamed protein product [Mytilus coruscus]